MKLPAFFGHKRSINLLPHDKFESSTLGIILSWSLRFGKWSVILTQLIVMGAFIYRFTLDRGLTDLRKSIAKDVAIIKSYDQVERDFILTQKQVTQAKLSTDSQTQILKTMAEIERITPSSVWFERVTISPSTLTLSVYAASLSAFGQFLTTVQSDPLFSGIRIAKLESSNNGSQMQFDISMEIKP
ncbi:hypothetical protein COT54_00020 [Candidatus Collierbacteria bacterium CG09_land_8_20_14_0_10_46_12]|uniref:Uncharacterized protein n=2 Tax=Candidatus Collieribacteriota TaxID=1752725 RepID=A0A2H0X0D8_9BACT|nr:MAG: hypothetical protein COT54_00020 [Candidatus Collierbacteria bacterium CG09_land_8_20_14_0_10_46_12]